MADDRAQLLQDFMEQHHARCLRASEWDAIVAFLDMHPKPKARHFRHVARGTEYELIGVAELQDSTGIGVSEGTAVHVYSGEDGKLWARCSREFNDGRFEEVES